MQKRIYTKKILFLLTAIAMMNLKGQNVSAAMGKEEGKKVTAEHMDLASDDLDSHEDDPVAGKLDKDDFANPKEWEAYMEQHPELQGRRRAAVLPDNRVDIQAELRYTVKGLPIGRAIQKFYIKDNEIYITQRYNAATYLSRCVIDQESKVANYADHMVLENFGHGQTLEYFEHNGKPYFWISCKANEAYNEYWAMQIGRLEYQAGKTITNYTKICRFSTLNYANQNGTSIGSVKRVDAALSEDGSKLLLWVQNTSNAIQYSYYDTRVLNSLLDQKEGQSSKYIEFMGNDILRDACYGSFIHMGVNDRILPNNSQQGLDFADDNTVYIVGGGIGEQPRLAVMPVNGSSYRYACLGDIHHESFGKNSEVEGLQLIGDKIYFAICESDQKKEQQYIFSMGRKSTDMSNVSHSWNGGEISKESTCTEPGEKTYVCRDCGLIRYETIRPEHKGATEVRDARPATCTEEGYTGDTYCITCNAVISTGTSIPATGHKWDGGRVTTKPTATQKGIRTYYCTACGTSRTESVKANGAPPKGRNLRYGSCTYKVTKAGLKGGTVQFVKTSSKAKGIRIPATVKIEGITYKVTSIATNAFRNNKNIEKLITGDNVTTIGHYAFSGCTRLTAVSIRSKVTNIGDKAFYKCSKLKGVTIPASVNKIGKQAFYGCKRLKTLHIKTTKLSAKRVGSKAFKGIYSKATIKVPKKKLTAYKKLMKQKGVSKKAKIKK